MYDNSHRPKVKKQEESLDYLHGGERKSWKEEESLEAMVNLC